MHTLQEQGECCSLPCLWDSLLSNKNLSRLGNSCRVCGVKRCLEGIGVSPEQKCPRLGSVIALEKAMYLCSGIPWDTESSGKQQGCQEHAGTQPGWPSVRLLEAGSFCAVIISGQ